MLFENTNIKTLELKNRLVRSATHEGMSDENGFPTRDLFKLYERLAKGGIWLITTGFAFVCRDGKSPFIGMQGIDSDDGSGYRENYRGLCSAERQGNQSKDRDPGFPCGGGLQIPPQWRRLSTVAMPITSP